MCGVRTKAEEPIRPDTPFRDEPSPDLVDGLDSVFQAYKRDVVSQMEANPSGKQYKGYRVKSVESEVRRLMQLWGMANIGDLAQQMFDAADPPLKRTENESVREGLAWVASARPDVVENVPLSAAEGDESDLPAEFGLGNPRAAQILERRRTGLLRAMQESAATLSSNIGNALAEGVGAGENIDKLSRRVQGVFDAETPEGQVLSRARAERIARTETAEAQTEGQIAGMKATNLNVRKVWRLAPNACEFCRAVDRDFGPNGKSVDIDDNFLEAGPNTTVRGVDGGLMKVNFRNIRGAPLHPHCRCDIEILIEGVDTPVRRPGT